MAFQQANYNVNSTINQISVSDKEGAQLIADALRSTGKETTVVYNSNNSDKLNKLYRDAAEIVNTFDSIFYLSSKDIAALTKCIDKLEVFEEDFETESDDGNIFYNNLLVILHRLDKEQFIAKYEQVPEYVKNNITNKGLYSSALFELKRTTEAVKITDEIISISDDEKYFIQKCYFLFIDGNFSELKRVIAKRRIKKDKNGYYGLFELEILNNEGKTLTALKRLNRKYKNKPLYHLGLAEIAYKLGEGEKTIKDNIKLAFANIKSVDLALIMKLIDTALLVRQEEYILTLIGSIDYDSMLITSKILDILIYKKNKTENDIALIQNIMQKLEGYELVDMDIINAILSVESHKELKAIDHFVSSYSKKKSMYTATQLLTLILKNNDVRNFDKITDCILTLSDSENANDHMLIAHAYLTRGEFDLAMESSYVGAILSKNNTDIFMRFWAMHSKCSLKTTELTSVEEQCVVALANKRKTINIAFDKNITMRFNVNNFMGVKFNRDNLFELNILGKIIGDKVVYDGETFVVEKIINKYDFFLRLVFSKIDNGKFFKTLKSKEPAESLQEIKELLIEDKKSNDEWFEAYDIEKNDNIGLPLSDRVNNEDRTYRDIMLHLLYAKEEYKLYSGDINAIGNQKIVVDITSLVLLEEFDLLTRVERIKERVYITQSTINTISKTFNYYLNNKKDTLSILVDDNNELRKHEVPAEEYRKLQEFWRNVLENANKMNIVNHEATMYKDYLECCQTDTIDYSVKSGCVLVSEDLLLRKLAYYMNDNKSNSTNFMSLVEELCENEKEYINIIKILSKCNYVQCINADVFLRIYMDAMENKEYQQEMLEIIDNLLKTEYLYKVYAQFIAETIAFIRFYINVEDEAFYLIIIDKFQEYSKLYNNSKVCVLLEKLKSHN